MLVGCALSIGGNAMEIVAVVPPIMKARRVAFLPLVCMDLLIVPSLWTRWTGRRSVNKSVDNDANSVPCSVCRWFEQRRALKRRTEMPMWIAERGEDPDFASLINPNR